MMDYKGYIAGPILFSPEEKTFSGMVAGLRDVIHFEAASWNEITNAFRDSIDAYVQLCIEGGTKPEPPPPL